jgi:hypothetical protein
VICSIVREEGFFSLWRGVLPTIIGYYPAQILSPSINIAVRNLLIFGDPEKEYWKFFMSYMTAGVVASIYMLHLNDVINP